MFFRGKAHAIFRNLGPVKPRSREHAIFGNFGPAKLRSREHAILGNLKPAKSRTSEGGKFGNLPEVCFGSLERGIREPVGSKVKVVIPKSSGLECELVAGL
jgi:hypothetical protein